MSVQFLSSCDPMLELNFILERCFAQPSDIPNSVSGICGSLSLKYSIPSETLTSLVAPAQALEEEILSLLDQHAELLRPFFQPNSPNDHRLIWAFFHLIVEQQTESLSQPETLRHLIALTLNRSTELPPEVQDFENLLQFLAVYPCSEQTKWLCSQLWRQPQYYLALYQELLALCTPVIETHEAPLQKEFDAAIAQTQAALAGEPADFMQQFGMKELVLDAMIVRPSVTFFNGISLIWDSLVPGSPYYFVPGIYHDQLGDLIRQYSDNTEYLCDRLKAISDQRRLDILKLIKAEPLCGQDLSERIGLSPATISHHMNSLVSAGFINVGKQSPRVSYSINREFIKDFLQNLTNTLL